MTQDTIPWAAGRDEVKAVFLSNFNYTSRRVNAGWAIKADPKPQNWPREVVMAAIIRRKAVPVLPRRKP